MHDRHLRTRRRLARVVDVVEVVGRIDRIGATAGAREIVLGRVPHADQPLREAGDRVGGRRNGTGGRRGRGLDRERIGRSKQFGRIYAVAMHALVGLALDVAGGIGSIDRGLPPVGARGFRDLGIAGRAFAGAGAGGGGTPLREGVGGKARAAQRAQHGVAREEALGNLRGRGAGRKAPGTVVVVVAVEVGRALVGSIGRCRVVRNLCRHRTVHTSRGIENKQDVGGNIPVVLVEEDLGVVGKGRGGGCH